VQVRRFKEIDYFTIPFTFYLHPAIQPNIRKVNERVWEWGGIDKKVSMLARLTYYMS
jgi:hypothetical protein